MALDMKSTGLSGGNFGAELDDYEEGTHVTAHAQTDGTTFTMNTSYDEFSYTKIGKMVHVNGYLVIASVGGSPTHTKLTFPYTPASLVRSTGTSGILTYEVDFTGDGAVCIYVGHSQAFCQMIASTDNAGYNHVTARAGDEYGVMVTFPT